MPILVAGKSVLRNFLFSGIARDRDVVGFFMLLLLILFRIESVGRYLSEYLSQRSNLRGGYRVWSAYRRTSMDCDAVLDHGRRC